MEIVYSHATLIWIGGIWIYPMLWCFPVFGVLCLCNSTLEYILNWNIFLRVPALLVVFLAMLGLCLVFKGFILSRVMPMIWPHCDPRLPPWALREVADSFHWKKSSVLLLIIVIINK